MELDAQNVAAPGLGQVLPIRQTDATTDLITEWGLDWRAHLQALRMALEEAERRQAMEVVNKMVSIAEVGQKWGYSSQALSMIRKRHRRTFPKPLKAYGQSQVFWEPDVDAFMEKYGIGNVPD